MITVFFSPLSLALEFFFLGLIFKTLSLVEAHVLIKLEMR